MSIEDELAGLQDDWTSAEEGGVSLPDGNYTFKIETASVGKSQSSGRLQMGIKLKVVMGEHAGKEIWNYQGLDNAKSMGWFKRNMARLEIQLPDQLSELPAWCAPALSGITFLAQVKSKDGFTNVYPQRRVEIAEGEEGQASTPSMGM